MHSFVTVTIPLDAAQARRAACALSGWGNLHRRATPRRPADPWAEELRDALDRLGMVHFLAVNVLTADDAGPDPDAGDEAGGAGDGGAGTGEAGAAGGRRGGHLLLEASCDGAEDAALRAIAGVLRGPLRGVFDAAGAPADDPARFAAYLLDHRREIGQRWGTCLGLVFSGTPGMTVERIREEDRLARAAQRKIAGLQREDARDGRAPCPASAARVLQEVRRHLWAEGEKWAFFPEPIPWLARGRRPLLPALALGLLAVFGPLLLAAVLAVWAAGVGFLAGLVWTVLLAAAAGAVGYWRLRVLERRDRPRDETPRRDAVERISERENHAAQNHLFAVSALKPGRTRRLALRVAFAAVAGGVARAFRPGLLGEIGTIHFARWIVLPGTDTLVFLSNYGGSWESYLEDFIEKAHYGLTGIWSNTRGFPKTRNLIQGGASDGDRFKRWARRQQRPTGLWYSAYPELTTARIRTNAAVRHGLACAATEGEARDWLACFGSTARSPEALDAPEIPALVFGGFSRLRHGLALVVAFEPAGAKGWLAALAPALAYGDAAPGDEAKPGEKGPGEREPGEREPGEREPGEREPGEREKVVAAFSATGLAALGLSGDALATFPVAFQSGMHEPSRARALGDVGEDAPEAWLWGGPGTRADALLVMYASDGLTLDGLVARQRAGLARFGHREVSCVRFDAVGGEQRAPVTEVWPEGEARGARAHPAVEPFGFHDGASQPVIRGTRRWTRRREQHHVVAPGEIVLGYPDNRGYIPPSPNVPAAEDPDHLLPAYDDAPSRDDSDDPDLSRPRPTGRRDFGRDGTFLVVRQLAQDVGGFWGFVARAAEEPEVAANPDAPRDPAQRREWIAAKLVGRWKDGTSLVRSPDRPPGRSKGEAPGSARPDNDFLYGADDRDGRRCPLGAHVRRANPRDSLDPDSPVQLAVSNRHRILRVGRSYRPQDVPGREEGLRDPGLFFMCLNADIERQFEFVQQSWAGSQSFHGLAGEVDCFAARGGTERITIPTSAGPLCLKRMSDFVRVLGGGYFFLPGRRALRHLAEGPAAPRAPRLGPAPGDREPGDRDGAEQDPLVVGPQEGYTRATVGA